MRTSHCQGEIVGRYYYVLNSPFHPFDNPSYTMALWWTIERLSWALWALGSGLMTVLQEGIYVFKQAPCPSVRTARQKNALVFYTIILQEILYFLKYYFFAWFAGLEIIALIKWKVLRHPLRLDREIKIGYYQTRGAHSHPHQASIMGYRYQYKGRFRI